MTLADLQTRLQELVAAEPLLANRPVLVEDKNNLVAQVEQALAEQSLCVVIAPAAGDVKEGALAGRAAWVESLEIAIHRGLLDTDGTPSTVAVFDALRLRLHGADISATRSIRGIFACRRHELRENGDGTYVRVLTVSATIPV